jgi:hypothetical protein
MLLLLNKNNLNMSTNNIQNGTNMFKLSTYDLATGVRSTSLDEGNSVSSLFIGHLFIFVFNIFLYLCHSFWSIWIHMVQSF